MSIMVMLPPQFRGQASDRRIRKSQQECGQPQQ